MAFFLVLAAIYAVKTVAILCDSDGLVRKSQSFSVFTPEDVEFCGAC